MRAVAQTDWAERALILHCRMYPLTAYKNITELFEHHHIKLFNKITDNPEHCLHQLLPPKRDMHGRSMRRRGHEYQLPFVKFEMHKISFIKLLLHIY